MKYSVLDCQASHGPLETPKERKGCARRRTGLRGCPPPSPPPIAKRGFRARARRQTSSASKRNTQQRAHCPFGDRAAHGVRAKKSTSTASKRYPPPSEAPKVASQAEGCGSQLPAWMPRKMTCVCEAEATSPTTARVRIRPPRASRPDARENRPSSSKACEAASLSRMPPRLVPTTVGGGSGARRAGRLAPPATPTGWERTRRET